MRNFDKLLQLAAVAGILLISACQSGPESPQETEISDFEKLCQQLPAIKLPFELNCFDCCIHPKLTMETAPIKKYLPKGSTFVGVLDITDTYISLLVSYPADLIIPSVCTFSLDGQPIAEQHLLGGACGEDYEVLFAQHLSILSTTEFLETDTTLEVMMEPATYEVLDTLSVEVEQQSFRITEKGEIEASEKG